MPKEIDYDKMTDDEIEAILNDIDLGRYNNTDDDDLDGDNEAGSDDDSDVDNDDDHIDDQDDGQDQDDDFDDTDIDNDTDLDDETNDNSDGDDQDTSDDDDDGEGNSQDGNEGSDDNDAKDGTPSGETGLSADDIKKYKEFYDAVVNAEFIANGKKVKGFSDPQKLIQAQQMSYGYSQKMAGFNKYKPFLKALQDNGVLEDEAKFNFAMSLIKGDKGALKQHIETLQIDPTDLTLDEDLRYSGQNNFVASKEELVIDEAVEIARMNGFEDKLRVELGSNWDNESFQEFVREPSTRRDLLDHMRTGAYDVVMAKVQQLRSVDVDGSYSSMKTTDQYRAAVGELTREQQAMQNQGMMSGQNNMTNVNNKPTTSGSTKTEAQMKQEAEYARKVAEKNRQADEARKKASTIKRRANVSQKQAAFDPLALEGDELDELVNQLIGR